MKIHTVVAAACLMIASTFTSGAIMIGAAQASSANQCAYGNKTDNTCLERFRLVSKNIEALKQCIYELKFEYEGGNYSGAGKGPKYDLKKGVCQQWGKWVIDDMGTLYVLGGDTRPQEEVENFIADMDKGGVYEGDIAAYPPADD